MKMEGKIVMNQKMKQLRAVGLFTMVASASLAVPAQATIYMNYHTSPTPYFMGVGAGSTKPGTGVVTWTCDDTTSQNWSLQNAESGFNNQTYYQLVSAEPAQQQLCLALAAAHTTEGTQAITWMCSPSPTQDEFWSPVQVADDAHGNPCYYFQNELATQRNYSGTGVVTPWVLGVAGGTPGLGTELVIWPWQGFYVGSNQVWCDIGPTCGSYYGK